MQLSTLLTDVRRELLEINPVFWSDAELIRHANRAELDYTNKTRVLEGSSYATLVQGQTEYVLPSDCISVRLMMHNVPNSDGNDNWRRIYPTNLEKIAQEKPNFLGNGVDQQGGNQRYWIWDNTLIVQPPPDATNATSIWLYYKAKPSTMLYLTDSINLPEELSEAITEFILWKAWDKEEEDDKADKHHQEYLRCIGEGRKWLKKRSSDQRFKLDIDSPISFNLGIPGYNPFQL
jgi:hypothetical protein